MLSENTFNSVFRRLGYEKEVVTAHGFRSTASTILHERAYESDVVEAALPIRTRTQFAEQMQDWSDLLDGFLNY